MFFRQRDPVHESATAGAARPVVPRVVRLSSAGRPPTSAAGHALADRVAPVGVRALDARLDDVLCLGRRLAVIDLRAVGDIDVPALSKLCVALRNLSSGKAGVAIVGADPRVRWVLELCQIDGLEFQPSTRAALALSRVRSRRPPRLSWRGFLARVRPRLTRSASRAPR
jgi:anti-anti-sigma regulatory factor